MNSDTVVFIMRFMPQKRVNSFLSGELYLNTLEYFAELEGDSVRSDIHEGAHYAWQLTQIELADDNGKFLNISLHQSRFVSDTTPKWREPDVNVRDHRTKRVSGR
jgi:hypothetical protein